MCKVDYCLVLSFTFFNIQDVVKLVWVHIKSVNVTPEENYLNKYRYQCWPAQLCPRLKFWPTMFEFDTSVLEDIIQCKENRLWRITTVIYLQENLLFPSLAKPFGLRRPWV